MYNTWQPAQIMKNSYEHILDQIGNTPLVRLRTGIPEPGPRCYVKLEWTNPTGSIKDRMTAYVIRKALADGRLRRGDTVIDNTSGNTGSALAMVAAVLGLKCLIVTPRKTSQEKIDLITSFGAEVIITPTECGHHDPEGCYQVARRLAREHGYFDLDQYNSQENVEAHYMTTGPEIWEQTEGKITHFVGGIGTGGTVSGTGKFLKEKNPAIKVIAVDPEGSMFAEYLASGKESEGLPYKVEGIGSDVLTEALHPQYIDQVVTVADRDSFLRAREIAKREGISGGGSSGAIAYAMAEIAQTLPSTALVIGIFADGGIRYLTKCYNDRWMVEQGFLQQEHDEKLSSIRR